MKMWPVIATAVMSSACVWACNGDGADDGGEGGQGGEATGGAASGGAASGGAGTGGAASGGLGGTVSCDPEDGSEAWGGAGGAGGAGSVEIFGDWTDGYGTYSFDESSIVTGYTTYDVVGFSDGGQYIVAQNSETDAYYPCLFSRFDWLVDGEAMYLCRSVLGAASAEEALAAPGADREDLEHGCGSDFAWSALTPQ